MLNKRHIGKKRNDRVALNGFLLLDKPVGISSNQALQQAKRLLNVKKAGHSGSLDPIATGLLPLCLGQATKMSQFLLNADKRYRAEFRLGEATTTYDIEGDITETRPVDVTDSRIEQVLEKFRGQILQVPPMYSAIKKDGQALYKLARQGIEIERQPREVTVYDIRLLARRGNDIEIEMHCSKGTYVRSIAHDMGQLLGCGAHVTRLQRLSVGRFSINQAVKLEVLSEDAGQNRHMQHILPIDYGLEHFPAIKLTSLATHYLNQGQAIFVNNEYKEDDWLRLYGQNDQFLGVGQVLEDGRIAPRRLLVH